MIDKVAVFTRVYRNEPIIRKSIESVLNQTYKNLRYYILVSDDTFPVINEYAEKDIRIEILRNDVKNTSVGFITYMNYISSQNDYVCTLDADDWYDSSFIEKMIHFMKQNELEYACCGSSFEIEGNKCIGDRSIERDIVWEASDMDKVLCMVLGFFRPLWGKIFSAKIISNDIVNKFPNSEEYGGYGGDTILSLMLSKNAKRFGVMSEILHHYRISQGSSSNKILTGRLNSDGYLLRFLTNYLKEYGEISDYNYEFLLRVYTNGVKDTIALLQRNCENNKLWISIIELFSKPEFKKIVWCNNNEIKNYIFDQVFNKYFIFNDNYLNEYIKILLILYPEFNGIISKVEFKILLRKVENLKDLVNKNYIKLSLNLINNLGKVPEKKECIILLNKISNNKVIKYIIKMCNVDFICNNKKMVKYILLEDYSKALKKIKNIALNDKKCGLEIIEIYLDLAAITNNSGEFINAYKLKAKYYYLEGNYDKYKLTIEELKEMGIKDVCII